MLFAVRCPELFSEVRWAIPKFEVMHLPFGQKTSKGSSTDSPQLTTPMKPNISVAEPFVK